MAMVVVAHTAQQGGTPTVTTCRKSLYETTTAEKNAQSMGDGHRPQAPFGTRLLRALEKMDPCRTGFLSTPDFGVALRNTYVSLLWHALITCNRGHAESLTNQLLSTGVDACVNMCEVGSSLEMRRSGVHDIYIS